MFRSNASVQKLLQESPIYFALEPLRDDQIPSPIDSLRPEAKLREETRQKREAEASVQDIKGAEEMVRPSTLLFERRNPRKQNFTADASHNGDKSQSGIAHNQAQPRHFRLIADVSKVNHHDEIDVEPYSGKFTIRPNMVQEDLANTVPLEGLSEVSFSTTRLSRLRIKDKAEVQQTSSLGQLWKTGLENAEQERKTDDDPDSTPLAGNGPSPRNMDGAAWGVTASIQQAVHDVGEILLGGEDKPKKRRYRP
jgi:hypothetical protein